MKRAASNAFRGAAGLLVVGLAGGGLMGCLDEFQDPTIVDSLRILAAQVEPPEIRPSQSFVVRPLVYSPRTATPEVRWAMCLLEAPFTRPFGDGGGGLGGQNSEPIPSEQGAPPPSCIDREQVIEPLAVREDGSAEFALPLALRGLLEQLASLDLPEIDTAGVPEELRALLTLPDQFLLATLHGVNVTVSLEVSDGTETLLANKRVPIKLVPEPGPIVTPVRDDVPGPAEIQFGWEPDRLAIEARFAGGMPPAGDDTVLRVYMPRHYWDEDSEAQAKVSTNSRGPEGAQLQWFGQGAAFQVAVDLGVDPVAAQVFEAVGGGSWRRLDGPAHASVEVIPGGVRVSTDPIGLGGPSGRAVAFLVTVSKNGVLVDTVPDKGWRYVHGGLPNTNPDPPTGGPGDGPLTFLPDELRRADQPRYSLVTVRGEVVNTAERRTWSWFTDRGTWRSRRTLGEAVTEEKDRQNTWVPGPDGELSATRFVVVRDGRGGTAWTDLSGVLPSVAE